MKRTLGVRHYVRYVDDFVLLSEKPDQLRSWETLIREFLRLRLRLERGLTVALAVQRPGLWPGTIQPRELRFLIENQPAPGHRGTCAGTKTAGECRA